MAANSGRVPTVGSPCPPPSAAAGDHDVASGLDCARSGPQVTDLGGRGDTRVVRAPNPRKVLTETDGQQRRVGGDRRGEQLGLARDHPIHQADAERAIKLAQVPQLLIEHQCATGATDPDHAQPAGTRDRCGQRTPGYSPIGALTIGAARPIARDHSVDNVVTVCPPHTSMTWWPQSRPAR
jgi:hypothetical protein